MDSACGTHVALPLARYTQNAMRGVRKPVSSSGIACVTRRSGMACKETCQSLTGVIRVCTLAVLSLSVTVMAHAGNRYDNASLAHAYLPYLWQIVGVLLCWWIGYLFLPVVRVAGGPIPSHKDIVIHIVLVVLGSFAFSVRVSLFIYLVICYAAVSLWLVRELRNVRNRQSGWQRFSFHVFPCVLTLALAAYGLQYWQQMDAYQRLLSLPYTETSIGHTYAEEIAKHSGLTVADIERLLSSKDEQYVRAAFLILNYRRQPGDLRSLAGVIYDESGELRYERSKYFWLGMWLDDCSRGLQKGSSGE